jgi:hypothetical protein
MFRKVLVSLVATAALGAGIVAMTSAAEAHHHHHHGHVNIGLGFFPFFGGYPAYGYGYGYPAYGYRNHYYSGYRNSYYYDDYDDYDDYSDCGYRRVAVKKWNNAHTHRIVVHRKRWVCY